MLYIVSLGTDSIVPRSARRRELTRIQSASLAGHKYLKMDFKFQAVFSHINPTNDQMKAILQDFWRKNEENQAEIIRLQKKEAESQAEIVKLQRKEADSKAEIAGLRYEYEKCKV